jgi:hypothetical protein
VLAANAYPHFTKGIPAQRFPTVFGAPHHHLALRAAGEGLGSEADALLGRAARSDDWYLRVGASRQLANPKRIEQHRAFLEEMVEGWPEPLSSPGLQLLAKSVRAAVFGGMHSFYWEGHRLVDSQLYAAHRELRQPSAGETYRRALRTLLHTCPLTSSRHHAPVAGPQLAAGTPDPVPAAARPRFHLPRHPHEITYELPVLSPTRP